MELQISNHHYICTNYQRSFNQNTLELLRNVQKVLKGIIIKIYFISDRVLQTLTYQKLTSAFFGKFVNLKTKCLKMNIFRVFLECKHFRCTYFVYLFLNKIFLAPFLLLYYMQVEFLIIYITADPRNLEDFVFLFYNSWWYINIVSQFTRLRNRCSYNVNCRKGITRFFAFLSLDVIALSVSFILRDYLYYIPTYVVKFLIMCSRHYMYKNILRIINSRTI